jgi:hypothetical protein
MAKLILIASLIAQSAPATPPKSTNLLVPGSTKFEKYQLTPPAKCGRSCAG